MACEAEWDAYQQAISARIAAEIIEELAIENRQAAQLAEWNACMAWWYCGQQGMQAGPGGSIPSLSEAQLGREESQFALNASKERQARLKLQYQRLTGKPYEGK